MQPKNKDCPHTPTVSVTKPSSGLGSASRSAMLARTVLILRLGFQAPFGGGFRMSRQILPSASMLGWYTGVINRILGGSIGYLRRIEKESWCKLLHCESAKFQIRMLLFQHYLVGIFTLSLNTPDS